MSPINNVNVNVSNRNPNANNNDNGRMERAKQVDLMIDKLQTGLKAQDTSRAFLAKACWKLPEQSIWNNYEAAIKGTNPMGLFIWLCKKAGV